MLCIIFASCAPTVLINTQPDSAEIYIDNKFIGITPLNIDSDDLLNHQLILKNDEREITVSGFKKRYWGLAYSKMWKFYWKGIEGMNKSREENDTCDGFFECFLQTLFMMVVWSVPSIFAGLPSVITPDIYTFNMDIPYNLDGYNLKWVEYQVMMDFLIKEKQGDNLVYLKKEYSKEIKRMGAPYYYKGFSVYNIEDIRLLRLIDIRRNAIGLMLGAYRFSTREKTNSETGENMHREEYSFMAELDYTRVLSKNVSLSGNLGITGGTFESIISNAGFTLSRFNLTAHYNYSPFSWLGISPGLGAGLFFYNEAGSKLKLLSLPVTSLDLHLSPNSLFNFAFTFTVRVNGSGGLLKNHNPADGMELLGGFRWLF